MASRIIPKEKLSTYEYWQMEAFGGRPLSALDDEHGHQGEEDSQGEQQVSLTDENTRQDHAEGYMPGYEAGHKAGYEAGYEEGRAGGYKAGYEVGHGAGAKLAAAEAGKLETLLQGFQEELSLADQVIGHDLLMLALGLAKQMTREALRIKPELVCAVIRECLQQEPAFGQPAQLFLNPEDAALVRQYLNHELDGWVVCVDQQLERGGCRIKVGHSQTDATLGTRWQRIAQSLGQTGSWLE
jgi:flagellar assembly protein FliH